jgi:P-type E1-E2 ATPase
VGARAAIQRLYDLGLEVVLLTGDQRGAVEQLALGLEVGHIKAELSPDERGREVRSLREAGGKVASVGRPGEDDAALAAADVGIVLGAAGGAASDRAVTLVGDDLRDAAGALWIAHTAREVSRRATRLGVVLFALTLGAAATGLLVPAVAAAVAVLIDVGGLGSGARLLRRIALRLPARS